MEMRCAYHEKEKAVRTNGLSLPNGQAMEDAGQDIYVYLEYVFRI